MQHVPAVPYTSSMRHPGSCYYDSLISWCISLDRLPPITINREVSERFREALLQSELCDVIKHPASADDYFHTYHEVLQRLADQFAVAPVRKITIRRQHIAVWMDAECRQLRHKSRMLERRYGRSKQSSDRQKWIEHERVRHQTSAAAT